MPQKQLAIWLERREETSSPASLAPFCRNSSEAAAFDNSIEPTFFVTKTSCSTRDIGNTASKLYGDLIEIEIGGQLDHAGSGEDGHGDQAEPECKTGAPKELREFVAQLSMEGSSE